ERDVGQRTRHRVMRDCSLAAPDNRYICTRVGACQVRPTISMSDIGIQVRQLGGPAAVTGATRETSISTWAMTTRAGTPRALEGLTLGKGLRDMRVGNPRCPGPDNLELNPNPRELR